MKGFGFISRGMIITALCVGAPQIALAGSASTVKVQQAKGVAVYRVQHNGLDQAAIRAQSDRAATQALQQQLIDQNQRLIASQSQLNAQLGAALAKNASAERRPRSRSRFTRSSRGFNRGGFIRSRGFARSRGKFHRPRGTITVTQAARPAGGR